MRLRLKGGASGSAAILLLVVAGCAATGPRDRFPQRNLPEPSGICFPTAAIRDFRAVSSSELNVRTGNENWQYRVVLDLSLIHI